MTLLVTNLQKSYPAATTGGQPVTVLNQINLTVAAGEFVAITGQSGVGKSTLLKLISKELNPTVLFSLVMFSPS